MGVSDDVADGGGLQGGCELGDEVANLVGVGHEDEFRGMLAKKIFERVGEGVGGVGIEFRGLDGIDFRQLLGGDFCDDGGDVRA